MIPFGNCLGNPTILQPVISFLSLQAALPFHKHFVRAFLGRESAISRGITRNFSALLGPHRSLSSYQRKKLTRNGTFARMLKYK